ncbi:hypothetical protein ACHAWF_002357 [Thalassiosira exigua]
MTSGDNSPFHWLGLLKWSLAYSDGTAPAADAEPMKKEDVEFLEKVMSEGIIDEGERMKAILKDLTESMEVMLRINDVDEGEEKRKELEEDEMLELLEELRDIVEQIDYARAFMAMGGIPFLLGCATFRSTQSDDSETKVPKSIRKASLGVLSTMCQNNPPVQLSLLEHGHMPQLIQLFFDYTPNDDSGDSGDDSMREKAVQALSSSVRGHAIAEHILCQNEQGRTMLRLGLGMRRQAEKPPASLRKRSLFLLRALLTADDATAERHQQFCDAISFVCTHEIDEKWEENPEIREMSLAMLNQLLRQPPCQSDESSDREGASITILAHKDHIASIGVERIEAIRNLADRIEEREYAAMELDEWERLLVALAEAGKQ